jgi:hypothetical protein
VLVHKGGAGGDYDAVELMFSDGVLDEELAWVGAEELVVIGYDDVREG